jgi:hypothetical protein
MVLVLAAGCTRAENAPLATVDGAGPSTTTASTTPASSADTTTTTEFPVARGLQAWTLWWKQWEVVAWPPGPDNPNQLPPFTAPDVVESQRSFLAEWAPPTPVSVTLHPEVTETTANSMTVIDCALMVPPPSAQLTRVGVPVTGVIEYNGTDWLISSIEVDTESTCVPPALGEGAVAAWRSFWERFPEVWAEPDPGSPLIDEISTGDAKAYFEERVALSAREGWRLLGTVGELSPTPTAVAAAVTGGFEVTVADCATPVDGFGSYEGEGAEPFPALGDGQLWQATGSVAVLPGNAFKVADWSLEAADAERCRDALESES